MPRPCDWTSGDCGIHSQLAALFKSHAAAGPLVSYDVMTWASSTCHEDVEAALNEDGDASDASGAEQALEGHAGSSEHVQASDNARGPERAQGAGAQGAGAPHGTLDNVPPVDDDGVDDSDASGSEHSKGFPTHCAVSLVARLREIVAEARPVPPYTGALTVRVERVRDWLQACVDCQPLFALLRATEETALTVMRETAEGDPASLFRLLALSPSPLFASAVGAGAASAAQRDKCLAERSAANVAANAVVGESVSGAENGNAIILHLADLILHARAAWDAAWGPGMDSTAAGPMSEYRTRPNDDPASAIFSVHLLRRLARVRLVEACRVEGLGDLGEREPLCYCVIVCSRCMLRPLLASLSFILEAWGSKDWATWVRELLR